MHIITTYLQEAISHQAILVTGLSGSGKTTMAAKLAQKLGYTMVNTDNIEWRLIRELYPNVKSKGDLLHQIGQAQYDKMFEGIHRKTLDIIFKTLINKKLIIEGVVFFTEPTAYAYIDKLPKLTIYAIKPLSEPELTKRRLDRRKQRFKQTGKPPQSNKEIKESRAISKYIYNKHYPLYQKFLARYTNRITLVDN